ncbi:hypothetical protein X801_04894 [Opisthorchis viverrini]|uniref:Uncharacterized protein n=2 Tax=Opisthorchis viverrini TaxID=6198 RepID=A0A075ABI0_OPIVI|nr:hypothetical protein T265_07461 [Opisthorchis viverrini]KER25009.1 hypothetical protein T265_07461 [Opisthorchis viverrini]OON19242.1 hypothetical protein X801_04894 [Opisthorchis viverrini]
MKMSTACQRLYKRSTTRFPHMEHYKYDYYREPVLKDKVSGRGEKEPRAVCVGEMTVMLSCLKNHDFDEAPCTQLIDAFKACVQVAEAKRAKDRELRRSGVLEPGDEETRRLPASQVTKLLQRFPEPK